MNLLIEQYLDGTTTREQEAQLRAYLLSEAVKPEHEYLIPLAQHMSDQQEIRMYGAPFTMQDIASSDEMKAALRVVGDDAGLPYGERSNGNETTTDLDLKKTAGSATEPLSRQREMGATAAGVKTSARMRTWMSIAAGLILAIGVGSFIQWNSTQQSEKQQARLAYNETVQALHTMSVTLNKGTAGMQVMNTLEQKSRWALNPLAITTK